MKKLLFTLGLLCSLFGYGQIPTPIVSAPILEALAAEQKAWEVSDRLRTTVSSTVTAMSSVQSFVSRANQVSCTIDIFNNSINTSQQYGFYNCQLENKTNGIGNDLMMVMDVANTAMSALFISEPQDRLESIDRAINKYARLDSDMWDIINWVYDELDKKKRRETELHEVERLSGIPLLATEITGKPILIPSAGSDPNSTSTGSVSNFLSSGGIGSPNSFSFNQGFNETYRLLNIILSVAFFAGLISVIWAYASGVKNPHIWLIAYVVALTIGNILKAIFFI